MQLFQGIKMASTKKILCLSLFDILYTEKLDTLSTKTIYENAGVSANSFYYHFRDKYECASYLFRVILMQAMGDTAHSPDSFFERIGNRELIEKELQRIRQSNPASDNPAYSHWMEKRYEMWYTMAKYVRDHARVQFMNIYESRSTNSPYFELRSAWDAYFEHIHQHLQFKNDKQRDFLKEALFAFFELYLRNFALNPSYDFQRSDAMRLMKLRKGFYESCLESFELSERM